MLTILMGASMTIVWTIPFSTSLIHKSAPATSGACEFSSINIVKKPIQELCSADHLFLFLSVNLLCLRFGAEGQQTKRTIHNCEPKTACIYVSNWGF